MSLTKDDICEEHFICGVCGETFDKDKEQELIDHVWEHSEYDRAVALMELNCKIVHN